MGYSLFMVKRIVDVKDLATAQRIATELRKDGFRVGISGQTRQDGSHSGLFVVTGKKKDL